MNTTKPFVYVSKGILDSSLWDQSPETIITWYSLLLTADEDGIVRGTIADIADFARVSLKQAQDAITYFMAPDPTSRNPDFEGRRIERAAEGYLILNYVRYQKEAAEQDCEVANE